MKRPRPVRRRLPLRGPSPFRRQKHTAFPQYKSLEFTKMILLLGGWKNRKAMYKCWNTCFGGAGVYPQEARSVGLFREFCATRATVREMVRET